VVRPGYFRCSFEEAHPMTDRTQLINQVWACVEQAFVVGDLERAIALEHFLTALEELVTDDRELVADEIPT
jgi:hypothetical protein